MRDEQAKEREQIKRRFARHWVRFLEMAGVTDETPSVFLELHRAYGGPDRHYHNKKHIVEGLDVLETARKERPDLFADAHENAAIEFAFWKHDIVYVVGNKHNEALSGEAAERGARHLGFLLDFGRKVKRYVNATRHDEVPVQVGAQIVCDLDLSSLASPWEEFCENTRNIHREFSQYDTPTFMAGQRAFLAKLRDGRIDKNIYWTDWFRDQFEAKAQENLDRFIGGEFHEG